MTISLTKADGVARITLNRPDQGNAIDLQLAKDLVAAAEDVAADSAVRCVVLTGAGRMFCVGGDIGSFASAGDEAGPFLQLLADTLHVAVSALAEMAKPLVVLVNGPAAGAGMSLAALGDIVIAARSASFTPAYGGIGLTPDGGMSWLLPRLVGMRQAQEMVLTNRRVPSEEAANLGLVTRTVDDADLQAEGDALAAKLVAAPTAALGATRNLLRKGQDTTLAEQLELEAQSISAAGAGPEGREGVAAFLARRKPDFRNA
ncbi:enoyl-CoA hydratase/isomerase family protein [Sandaracinobacteroides hominis]|uniref:enoyl-CoA hydratase/isomerase family protein n=1 Tax=Sandaracinobacteroides hominis TaxID=2780086 RepID=UPI0018F3AE0E|nr:enoyl-CoA hydratase-related protein [Sandaracinobacteroides hominis]